MLLLNIIKMNNYVLYITYITIILMDYHLMYDKQYSLIEIILHKGL